MICSVEDCSRRHKAHGYCEMHWDRVRKHGSVVLPKKVKKICAIDGCGKNAVAQNLCSKHYVRMSRHGDPTYQNLSRAMTAFIYETALPCKDDDCLIWPFRLTSHGYPSIKRKKTHILVNRLICENFRGPPPSPDHHAAHECGVSSCVNPNHLVWKTPYENMSDRERHGTACKGERNGSSKLTEAQARQILALKGQKPSKEIAQEFGITSAMVNQIHRRAAWRHL